MPAVRFYWVDVFADVPLTGNPLSLVVDADALTDEEMRSIAREFNQSETTFLVAPSAAGADYRLRSFTAAGVEVLGAGHNAMGAWIWLAGSGALAAERQQFAQQIGEDVLPVWIERPGAGRPRVTMRQAAPRFLHTIDRTAEFAAALGLHAISLSDQPGEVVSTGAEHLLLAVKSRQDVDRAAPDAARLRALLADVGAEGCYLFTTEGGEDHADAYARFFNPTVGIVEDPATGTAAGPLAALLIRNSYAADGSVLILQGHAMGRPSLLTVSVDSEHVDLSGSGLVIGEGVMQL
ncbi:phenazine biosynthesis protein PhzF family [Microbacterium sp. B35-04]|uniref:PhzF family phenazine biosynthesis protein n=1 Tax=Microbacterium sp. B35-04 TaxID=1961716 RepID=UPI0013D6D6E2|nr:PhzF family phenazine biosynthesis protein [Microbacterium sp. B35-04]KAF2414324.1 phenazine biosynthesis protein PhzF family [Microbacterium sp. B35-04]